MHTSGELLLYANELVAILKRDLRDCKGTPWTHANFKLLKKFVRDNNKNSQLKCIFMEKGKTKEFMWDFIAWSRQEGIFLAAESEQASHNQSTLKSLRADFEKLLYVYAPIRVLITKAKNIDRAKKILKELQSYSKDCCQNFNPGAVFVIYFVLPSDPGVSYVWQSEGEPHPMREEKIAFREI